MKSKRLVSSTTVSLPILNIDMLLFSLKQAVSNVATNFTSSKESFSRLDRNNSLGKHIKRFLPMALLLLVVIVVVLVTKNIIQGALANHAGASSSDPRVQLEGAKAKMIINKSFNFSIKDDTGKEFTKIKYVIDSAELRDQIVVKGQLMTSVKGRSYLILTLDLTNSSDKAISFNSLNYVRLTINGDNSKLIAADIHNDPVLIQAISTKTTRLGFPVSDTDKNLVLHVGEVDGSKQTIPLELN